MKRLGPASPGGAVNSDGASLPPRPLDCGGIARATPEELLAEEVATYPDIPDYRIIQKIGDGAFSVVYKAVHRLLGHVVALKIIPKAHLTQKQHENVRREVMLMKSVCHHLIVRLLDFRDSPHNYVLVLEYMSGGELYTTLVKQVCFPEDVCRHIILQVGEALRYLHVERGIVHRDIKLENLLFIPSTNSVPVPPDVDGDRVVANPNSGRDVGVIKVADLGLSKAIFNTFTVTPCGTAGYTAPEILRCGSYSKGVDVWALGCVLYTMLCGFPPFFDDTPKGLFEKVAGGEYTFLSPWWDSISIEGKDLITHLLEMDPNKRYTITELLNHPWVRNTRLPPGHKLPSRLCCDEKPEEARLPLDVYSKNVVSAPLDVYRGMNEDICRSVQFIKLYKGNGAVCSRRNEHKERRETRGEEKASAKQIRACQRLGGDLKDFKLDIELSPIYNRRRGVHI